MAATSISSSPAVTAPVGSDSYLTHSARPLVSLVFVAPLVIGYEVGVLALGPAAVRNGAEVWMRWLLDAAGFGQYFLLPMLICGLLLGWHYTRHEPWQIRYGILPGMWLECVVLAVILLAVGKLQARVLGSPTSSSTALAWETLGGEMRQTAARIVAYLGAGLYEEVLFRLILVSAIAAALKSAGLNRRGCLIGSIAATSLLFAAAHYRFDFTLLGLHLTRTHGDPFTWFSFLFRVSAGAFFALLFAFRGFGIAAGTHAIYDLLLVLAA